MGDDITTKANINVTGPLYLVPFGYLHWESCLFFIPANRSGCIDNTMVSLHGEDRRPSSQKSDEDEDAQGKSSWSSTECDFSY